MRILPRFQFPLAKMLLLAAVAMLVGTEARAAEPDGKPKNLYLVSAGISAVPGEKPLPSCKKDAEDMIVWANSQKGKLADQIHITELLDQKATRKNTLDALRDIKSKAKAGDYSIVYLSSHGSCGLNGDFQFAAYDQSIAWSDIQLALRDVPGTVIVIIDACHCGGVKGENLIVFSASLKDQHSCGYSSARMNSLFTRFLVEGLKGAADFNKDGSVTLSEVETYVSNKLAETNQGKAYAKQQSMTVTRPGNVPSALPLSSLTVAAKAMPNLAGTTFAGSENLGKGYGKVSFQFLPNGKAVMIDAQSTVNGTFTVDGNQVVITLPGVCSYRGTINGTTIAGNGKDDTRTWDFTVSKK
jgi:hypothetical protein